MADPEGDEGDAFPPVYSTISPVKNYRKSLAYIAPCLANCYNQKRLILTQNAYLLTLLAGHIDWGGVSCEFIYGGFFRVGLILGGVIKPTGVFLAIASSATHL